MLFELSISNLAIIDALRLQFEPGFNLLTGETGTGKSIIIDAVTLLLGGRASTEDIRTGAESAVVEGVFLLSPETQARLDAALQEYGLADDAGQLILRREISRSRRSICRVNGRAVPLSVLQEIGGHLIDIHGQGEHLSLLQVRHHIDFLDRYGELSGQREAFGALARELGQVRSALNALRRDERELARRMDLLTYQVDEIAAARLQVGEDQELRKRRTLIANAEKRMELASKLYTLLYEGEERQRAVVDLLGAISEDLAELAKLDDTLSEPRQIAESALYQLEDLARTIRRYRDEVEYDPAELESIEERLELIQSLRRKYGESIPEILEFARRAQAELESISHSEERLEALAERESALLQELAVAGEDLSKARQQAAERLCRAVEAELADLNMERAQFLVRLERVEARDGVPLGDKRYAFDETGIDRVEFFIAPNPGEEPKPLAKTASGGETSRLMLALKTALSAIDPVPTLVFDEIDSGIGGRTGGIVGRKLWALAGQHQVFCVTHLAQIACYGRKHFRVSKDLVEGRTVSSARELSYEERVDEVAVLLGGAVTEATRKSAEELLQRAAETAPAPPST